MNEPKKISLKEWIKNPSIGKDFYSLRQLLYYFAVSEKEFLKLKSSQKEMIRNKIISNIIINGKNLKELFQNIDEEFKQIMYIKDNIIEIRFINEH